MQFLPELFIKNREWAAAQVQRDPRFFERLCAIQRPTYLWIGCADSRVPANTIIGLTPGEVFVHRNVSNIVREDDANCLSVLQYAIDVLKVSHVIVCGHYRCGGVQAATGPQLPAPLQGWLEPIRKIDQAHKPQLAALENDLLRWDRLCELNVISQVNVLQRLPVITEAWARGQTIDIHGWIYDLHDGLLRDLKVSVNGPV